MYPAYRIAASVLLLLSCFLLSSCDSSSSKGFPEGNIDVDSEIYIVPIGDVDEAYLHPLIPELEKRFKTKVHLALDKRMPDPEYAYDYEAQKHVGMYIMAELIKVDVPEDAKILGVANVDIFVHRSADEFLFGQSQFGKTSKAALISIYRMNPLSYVGGKRNDKLLVQRMVKEAVHELGNVFGVRNCAEPKCATYLARKLRDLDKKSDSFCLICQKEFRALKQSEKANPRTDRQ